jgi:hypothetical protein
MGSVVSSVGKQPLQTLPPPPPVKATVNATAASNGETKITATASQQLSKGRKLEFTSELSNRAVPNNRADFVSDGVGPFGSKSEVRLGIDNRGLVAGGKLTKDFGNLSATAKAEARLQGLSGEAGIAYSQPLARNVKASVGANLVLPENSPSYLNLPASLTVEVDPNFSVKATTSLNGRSEEPSTIGVYWRS